MKRLSEIQSKLRVGKDAKNDFGGYNYRTVDAILSKLRPLLGEGETVILSDGLCEMAGQVFVKATVVLTLSDAVHTSEAYALHPLTKKGMDPSQITGSASTYARKYAITGLLALDDGKDDPDAAKQGYSPQAPAEIMDLIQGCETVASLTSIWRGNAAYHDDEEFINALGKRRKEIEGKQNAK